MSRPRLAGVESKTIIVDGVGTHYLEAGEGPPVVLLHSGEFGACAEASWHDTIAPLARAGYRVVAPDWLGYGRTDKLVDFADPQGRRLRHMRATIEALNLGKPALIGNSMGGTLLARALALPEPALPASAAVLVSGGGFVPFNEARKALQQYDLTVESMATTLRTACYSGRLADDADYVAWRHELSLEPGAWQAVASARLRPPGAQDKSGFGQPDPTDYEVISVPVLVVAGDDDPLRLPGYASDLASRIPDCELRTYEQCGHLPHLEHSDRFVTDVLSFLRRRYDEGTV